MRHARGRLVPDRRRRRLSRPSRRLPAFATRAIFYRRRSHRVTLTALSPEQADTLAAHLADLGHPVSSVIADHDTATAFAETWQRHTGAAPVPSWHGRLYRLGTLTPPNPFPAGRGRVVAAQDQIVHWCGEFMAAVGETPPSPGPPRASPTNTSRSGRPRTALPSPWRARPRWLAAWSGSIPSTRRPISGGAATPSTSESDTSRSPISPATTSLTTHRKPLSRPISSAGGARRSGWPVRPAGPCCPRRARRGRSVRRRHPWPTPGSGSAPARAGGGRMR